MSKTTKQKIAQVVLETLESAELEAIEELTNAIVGLSNNVSTLTSVLLKSPQVKAEPKDDVQGDLFIQLAPVPVVEPKKPAPAVGVSTPPALKSSRPKKPAVQPAPVVETKDIASLPIEEPAVQPEQSKEPVILMEFTELQASIQSMLDQVVQEQGPEANAKFLTLAKENFVGFKVSKLAELPEDKYHTYFSSLKQAVQEKFGVVFKQFT
jgi:hypothetical protein